MNKSSIPKSLVVILGLTIGLAFAKQTYTDSQVRQQIIHESILNYSGNCPCPYSTMRNGNRCGGRSAYSKPGGASPICYPRDVTPLMIQTYRRMHGE